MLPLTTIDEVLNETVTTHQVDTSYRDDDVKLRSSKLLDFEDSIQTKSNLGAGLSIKRDGVSCEEEPMSQSYENDAEYLSYEDGFDDS